MSTRSPPLVNAAHKYSAPWYSARDGWRAVPGGLLLLKASRNANFIQRPARISLKDRLR